AGKARAKYEILNFAVPGYSVAAIAQHLEKKQVFDFNPSVLFLYAMDTDIQLMEFEIEPLMRALGSKKHIPGYVRDALHAIRRTFGQPRRFAAARAEAAATIIKESYKAIADASRNHGATPVLLFVPMAGRKTSARNDKVRLFEYATSAGFDIIDLS